MAARKRKTAKPRAAKPETVLVLRTCPASMISMNGFRWPESGPVKAPDWRPETFCGNGLHGWLWGEGETDGLTHWCEASDGKWLVVEVEAASIVRLGGKVKYPRGTVIFCGDRAGATALIRARHPESVCIGATVEVGDGVKAAVGDFGTATAGDRGTATAGYSGTATAGDRGTATAGDRGTATAGDRGTATAGDRGTAKAGKLGEIRIRWWDDKATRYRTVIGYVGEDGIEPDTLYRLDEGHRFVKAVQP